MMTGSLSISLDIADSHRKHEHGYGQETSQTINICNNYHQEQRRLHHVAAIDEGVPCGASWEGSHC
jgi:hypothetical protein